MFLFLFLFLASASAQAAENSCAKNFNGLTDQFVEGPREYRRIVFEDKHHGVEAQLGVAYDTEILPGLKVQVVKLDSGESWIVQERLELNRSIKPAKPGAEMPANYRDVAMVPRNRIHIADDKFRRSLCQAYKQVKNRPDYSQLRRMFAKGAVYNDRYHSQELRDKIHACIALPIAGIYLAGNFVAAPAARLTGYLIGGMELASHSSNFGYAVPVVMALNACFKGILPNHRKTAALLAGAGYVGINAWEEINFLGENQIGQMRTGPGESKIDTIRTDWPDFISGTIGAATMTAVILALQSDAYAGFKLAAFCRSGPPKPKAPVPDSGVY